MARYSQEFKNTIIIKMMPPENKSIAQIARETGLSEATLNQWRRKARAGGCAAPADYNGPHCQDIIFKFVRWISDSRSWRSISSRGAILR
mgnify:CR=1 FL=1